MFFVMKDEEALASAIITITFHVEHKADLMYLWCLSICLCVTVCMRVMSFE